jgi:ParB-like chromosome segregation protein Spo0J
MGGLNFPMKENKMKIQEIEIEKLIPYARNSRTHSDEQVAQIAASIKEFGWTNPILIDGEAGIIAGHGRLAAARKLGLKKIPVIELSHLSPTQKKALIIADNKLALNAGWDNDMLALEVEDLKLEGFDLELLGFDKNEIDKLFENEIDDEIKEVSDDGNRNLLLIETITETELQKLFDEMKERGFECKIMN